MAQCIWWGILLIALCGPSCVAFRLQMGKCCFSPLITNRQIRTRSAFTTNTAQAIHSQLVEHSRTTMVLSASIGKNVYTDNYFGKRQTKLTGLLLTLLDLVTDSRTIQYAPYFAVVAIAPLYHIFKSIYMKVSGRKDNPFPLYECEKCEYQIRPTKHTASRFFANSSFRCPRCGATGNSFFDVDDTSDPRAEIRLKRQSKINRKP
jgi:rubredoxin